MVAAATSNLCEAANSAVQGHASEEKLVSSAKQVSASTAQLLVACKVKADQDSQTMKRLQVRVLCTYRTSPIVCVVCPPPPRQLLCLLSLYIQTNVTGGSQLMINSQSKGFSMVTQW